MSARVPRESRGRGDGEVFPFARRRRAATRLAAGRRCAAQRVMYGVMQSIERLVMVVKSKIRNPTLGARFWRRPASTAPMRVAARGLLGPADATFSQVSYSAASFTEDRGATHSRNRNPSRRGDGLLGT